MKINEPSIPMRLPMNSIVSFRVDCVGAKTTASNAPITIIGIPTPTEICFEATFSVPTQNLYEFYESLVLDHLNFNGLQSDWS